MKMIDEMNVCFPAWAITAQEYGDYSGLSDEDTEMLHDWQRKMGETMKHRYSPTAKWQVVFTSETVEFDPHPEFGLPCSTNVARLIILDN